MKKDLFKLSRRNKSNKSQFSSPFFSPASDFHFKWEWVTVLSREFLTTFFSKDSKPGLFSVLGQTGLSSSLAAQSKVGWGTRLGTQMRFQRGWCRHLILRGWDKGSQEDFSPWHSCMPFLHGHSTKGNTVWTSRPLEPFHIWSIYLFLLHLFCLPFCLYFLFSLWEMEKNCSEQVPPQICRLQ